MRTKQDKSLSIFLSLALLAAFAGLFLSVGPLEKTSANKARHEDQGRVVAQVEDFELDVYGYSFRNFGNQHGAEDDLTAEDLIQIFGAENVCIEGSTAEDCVLYETAEKWKEDMIKMAGGGHCYGMAASGLQLMRGREFRGKNSPADWEEGAESTFDIKKKEDVINFITYYHVLQLRSEVYSFRAKMFKEKPSAVLKQIIDTMKEDKDLLTFSFWNRKDGRRVDGHSVTPYKVVDMGEGKFRVYIYDNNFPNDNTKFVAIDTRTEKWNYRTASDPNKPESAYVGDATTFTLSVERISDTEKEPFSCEFCEADEEESENSHAASNALNKTPEIEFAMFGEGDFLLTNPAGKRVGYDPVAKKMLDEIAGAKIIDIPGGMGNDLPPAIRLPFNPSGVGKPYTITVSGKNVEKEVDADFEILGPGFVVGFEYILLDPNESLTMTVSPDGQELSFISSADGETPNIFLTTEDGPDKPSYEIEIGGILLEAGKTMTVKLDLAKGRIYFSDNDTGNDKYDVYIERTNPNGTKNVFDSDDIEISKAERSVIDFSKWDGKSKLQINKQ